MIKAEIFEHNKTAVFGTCVYRNAAYQCHGNEKMKINYVRTAEKVIKNVYNYHSNIFVAIHTAYNATQTRPV